MGRKTTSTITPLVEATHEQLKTLIMNQNLSQRQLESLCGVSQGVISKSIFRNESVLNLSQFELICAALSHSPSIVLADAEQASRYQQTSTGLSRN